MTATIEQTIEVGVPIETAYNQWTQFEEFPRFMEGSRRLGNWMTVGFIGSPSSAASATSGMRKSWSSIRRSASLGAEKLGDVLGVPERRVKGDLQRFKEFIEARGQETGAWRGDIPREG